MPFTPLPEKQDHVYVGDGKQLPRCVALNNRGFRCEKPARKNHTTCHVHGRQETPTLRDHPHSQPEHHAMTTVERVARAIDPKTWAYRDTDLTRRDEWEREIKLGWGETTFEQWADRSIGKSLEQARAAIDAMAEASNDLVGEMEKALEAAKDAIGSLPEDALGYAENPERTAGWPIRDELMAKLGTVLDLSRMRDARTKEPRQ